MKVTIEPKKTQPDKIVGLVLKPGTVTTKKHGRAYSGIRRDGGENGKGNQTNKIQ